MFRIEDPNILYALLAIIPLALFFYFSRKLRQQKIKKLGDLRLLQKLTPDYSPGKIHLKFYLILSVLALLVLCLANPQIGTRIKQVERKGIDVMIALDISNSMNCEDIQPSRLLRSKHAILSILDKAQNDRIGLVVFAGDAFVQLPLTSDYSAAKLFVSNISTADISTQGTSIGKAISLCSTSLLEANKEKDRKNLRNKAIILISDGENHEDDALEEAKKAASDHIMVNTIGMGLPQGAPIPEYRGHQAIGYKKDQSGNTVITQLNEKMLEDIAQAGKGKYIGANNTSSAIEKMFEQLNHLDAVSYENKEISDYETRYQYLLMLALLLLLSDFFLFEKRNKKINRQTLFGAKNASVILLLFIPCLVSAKQPIKEIRQGNKFYDRHEYANADIAYRKALEADSTHMKALYNMGNAAYQQKKHEQAREYYEKLLRTSDLPKDLQAKVHHNMGNTYLSENKYAQSIEAYKRALKIKPEDKDTKYNLAYALKKLQAQENQENKQNKDKQNKDKQNKDKQNKDKQNKDQQNKDQQNKDKQNKDQQNKDQQNKDQQNKDQQNKDQQEKKEPKQGNQDRQMKAQEAERILKALENQEKNTLDKVKKHKVQTRTKNEKDW